MIWLASFPRSGNTYFRNILFDVYGIESSTFHNEPDYPVDPGYTDFQVVKTHLQPEFLEPSDPCIPSVYLVRDGRDAMVSISHHRKDIVAPGSDFEQNMQDAILAWQGSFFGGWSENARQWIERADIIIRYEDLIVDPIGQVERLRAIMDLPQPNMDKLPSFQQLKSGEAQYGSKSRLNVDETERLEFAKKFFRRGQSGAWKDEMPMNMQRLFWENHSDMMNRLGYTQSGEVITPQGICNRDVRIKLGLEENIELPVKRVLIESSKLKHGANDGVGRYVADLLRELSEFQKTNPDWQFDVSIDKRIFPLGKLAADQIFSNEVLSGGFSSPWVKVGKKVLSTILPERSYAYLINKAKKMATGKSSVERNTAADEQESKRNTYDLIHVTLPQNYWLVEEQNGKYITTVHDMTHLSHPEFHLKNNSNLCEEGLNALIGLKSDFICISKSTSRELERLKPEADGERSLVYQGVNRNLFKQNIFPEKATRLRAYYRIGDHPFFLTLSTIEPRKNLKNIVRGFEIFKSENPHSDALLVCAGNKGWLENKEYQALKKVKDVIFTGFIEDHSIQELFSEAMALCYVSHFEGFGLPILEAMACSTPVICGNNSSQPEVGGDLAFYADADSPEQIAQRMKEVYEHPNRYELGIQSFFHSLNFSTRKMACQTLAAYAKAIESK